MDLREFIEQLQQLEKLLTSAGRTHVNVFYERVPIKAILLKDDGTGCNNLDVILRS